MFDGSTYDDARDGERLGRQLAAVYQTMKDGEWVTLADLADIARGSVASVSARVRDLRKEKFGAHIVERRYVAEGVWEYRLVTE
jgi:hypothetical protein